MIKEPWLFLFFYVTSIFSFGQTSDNLEKKFSAEINANNSFAKITSINDQYYLELDGPKRKFNIYPEFTIAYSLNERIDVGLLHSRDIVGLQLYPMKFIFMNNNNLTPNIELPSVNITSYQYTPDNLYNIGTIQTYQGYFRIFGKNKLEPVGIYHQVAFGFNRLGIKNEIKGSLVTEYENTIPLELKIKKFTTYRLSYSFGYKKHFSNRIYFNSAVNINFSETFKLNSLFNSVTGNQNAQSARLNSNSYNSHFNYIAKLASEFNKKQFIELKVGLGYKF